MKDDFNTTAGDNAPPAPPAPPKPLEKLSAALTQTRRNLTMLEAAHKADWNAMRAAIDAGADPAFRNDEAMRLLTDDLSPDAVSLMQHIKHPVFPRLNQFPLVLAASRGDAQLVEKMLTPAPGDEPVSEDMISSAAFTALRHGHDAIADRLLPLLKPDNYNDRLMIALLLHRPAAYDAAYDIQQFPQDPVIHFINACSVKDEAAMNHVLDRMIEKKDALFGRFPLGMMDMGIMPYEETLSYLFQSGHLAVIDKYLDNFKEFQPSTSTLLHIAAVVGDAEGKLFDHLMQKLQPRENDVSFIVFFAAMENKRPQLLSIAKAFPEIAKKHPEAMLTSALGSGDPQAFFDALAAGHALPDDNAKKLQLLSQSLDKKLDTVSTHILQTMEMTPQLIADMQKSFNLPTQKKSAELSGDWRYEDDKLFWRGAETADAEILAQFAGVTDIKPAKPYAVASAVAAVIKRGDMALLEHIIAHTDWKGTPEGDEARLRAHRACLTNAAAAEKAAALVDTPPRKLEDDDLRQMAGDHFSAVLAVLKTQGFDADAETLTAALPHALRSKAAGMMAQALDNGASLATQEDKVASPLETYGTLDMVQLLEKWVARVQNQPAAGLDEKINAAANKNSLFDGPDCPAIATAYADRFSRIMKDADGGFDVQKLVTTKDAAGNSLLDILGAHGRLNDVLLPAVWKDRDAVTFIRDNTPPCYHPQCDFNGLAAGVHQLKLKERGHKRFILKGPGKA